MQIFWAIHALGRVIKTQFSFIRHNIRIYESDFWSNSFSYTSSRVE